MEALQPTEMLAAGPIAALIAWVTAQLAEAAELAPGSSTHFERARVQKEVAARVEEARLEAPTCSTEEAAEIMSVSTRQATKLAKLGRVQATQSEDGCHWTFDVRSCHAYAASKRMRKAS